MVLLGATYILVQQRLPMAVAGEASLNATPDNTFDQPRSVQKIVAGTQSTALHTLLTQGLIALNGTSMAAPAVTGIAALIMSRRQGLRSHQLKQILVRSARRDGAASDAPDDAWGHGKLDAASALEVALEARFPSISDVRVEGTVLSWRTDSSTTSFVRVATQRRQLLLGKNPRLRRSAKPGRMHEIDFRNEAAGTYFCEIVAVGPNEFFTEEDGLGRCFQVHVPTSRATRKTPTKRGGRRS